MAARRRRKRGYHTGIHESPKSGGPCKYRSGWELLLMRWFDAESSVASYGYESVTIPYVSNTRSGKTRRYLPDFLVNMADGSHWLVEVKPSKKLQQAVVKKKMLAGQRWCEEHGATYKFITEYELKGMGLL